MFTLPEKCKIVSAFGPKTTAGATTGDYISLKNAHKVWIVWHSVEGASDTCAISVNEATAVAGTGATTLSGTFPIWANQDCATSDTLVAQTAAAGLTTSATTKTKQVVIEVDPAQFSAGFDCMAVVSGASSASNLSSCKYYILERYQQATPPAAITD